MPNYGFVIDLPRCIGCHACTIACKAEHQIPVGVNRCWVKTVEKGTFPDTRRFFFPVLCNQCEDAPCLKICPTNALFRRRDGIVDLNGQACVGCRACMEACPYDQLFIDPNTRTAEKCNFCANRLENRLLPACVSVCPTACRIFGDLDDQTSEAALMIQRHAVSVRKPEKGTGPKIFYLSADESVIRPEAAVRPFIFKEGQVHLRPIASPVPMSDDPGAPRVDYDTPHAKPWGADMVLYLAFKAIATGSMLLSALLWSVGFEGPVTTVAGAGVSSVFISLTAVVLIIDLERPERFYYILTRPNWRSWMVWGAWFMTGHGVLSAAWLLAVWLGRTAVLDLLAWPVVVTALLATSYTGFLFAQGRARDLWQGPSAAVDLVAQSCAAGAASLLIVGALVARGDPVVPLLGRILALSLAAHLVILSFEHLLASSPTRHHELATETIRRGAYARLFWGGTIGVGGLLPILVLATVGTSGGTAITMLAALLALAGSVAWEYIWVEAGQSVPLA